MICLPARFACFSLLLVSNIYSATHTVDIDNPDSADFGDLDSAISEASPGDTLLLAGSSNSYGNASLDKELHLIGPGWNIKENFPDASPAQGAQIDLITFKNDSASGSSFTSLQITALALSNVSDIMIQRVRPRGDSPTATTTVSMSNVANIYLRQNYRLSISGYATNPNIDNLKVLNNILAHRTRIHATNAQIEHNLILDGPFDIAGATLRYNILFPGSDASVDLSDSLAEYNVSNQSSSTDPLGKGFWAGDNNVNDAEAATLFVEAGTFDSQYKLAPKSDASNINKTGIDAGPFGGSRPYVLSGMPSVPVIFQIEAPATAEAGELISISFKATAEPPIESSSEGGGGTD